MRFRETDRKKENTRKENVSDGEGKKRKIVHMKDFGRKKDIRLASSSSRISERERGINRVIQNNYSKS